MYCLKPITITSGMLTSSIAEIDTGEVAWVLGTTYAATDVRTYNTRKYERLVAGTDTVAPDLDANKWLDVGPTNKWAMFDTLRNTASTAPATITVTIAPGQRISALALMQCNASSATVTMTVGGSPVYGPITFNMLKRSPTRWSEYFFGTFKPKPALVLFDLPLYSASTITVVLTRSSGPVSIGAMCLGVPVYVGGTQYNAVSSALNFSTIERNVFGDANLLQRRSVPKTDQITWIPKGNVNSLLDLRSEINAVPCVWSGLDDRSDDDYFDSLLILGIYKEFSINLAFLENAQVTLQLEEV